MPESEGRRLFGERLVSFLHAWGSMEMQIDQSVALIYRHHDGEAARRQTPITIEKKLEFLTEAATKLVGVRPMSSVVDDLVSRVVAEKDLRNTLVHGWPAKIEANGAAHIVRLRPRLHEPRYELRVVEAKDWERLETTCWKVMTLNTMLIFGLVPKDVAQREIKNISQEWLTRGAETFPASKRIRGLLGELFAEPNKSLSED